MCEKVDFGCVVNLCDSLEAIQAETMVAARDSHPSKLTVVHTHRALVFICSARLYVEVTKELHVACTAATTRTVQQLERCNEATDCKVWTLHKHAFLVVQTRSRRTKPSELCSKHPKSPTMTPLFSISCLATL